MNPQSPRPAARRRETNNRPQRARAAAVITVATAAALLATACGGSPSSAGSGGSPGGGGSANAPSLVSYARCMRSHGVPNFPDPTSGGQIPGGKTTLIRLSQTDSRYQAAGQACQRLWPYQSPAQAPGQQLIYDLKFARCMRAHGVPNFPDPTNGPHGLVFVLSASRLGMDPHAPQLLAKAHQCEHVLPAGSGLPHATEAP